MKKIELTDWEIYLLDAILSNTLLTDNTDWYKVHCSKDIKVLHNKFHNSKTSE